MPNGSKTLIGALVAAALAIAVYYGFISRQQADNLQNQTNQTLGTSPPPTQPTSTAPTSNAPQSAPTPAPGGPLPQSPATAPAPAPKQ